MDEPVKKGEPTTSAPTSLSGEDAMQEFLQDVPLHSPKALVGLYASTNPLRLAFSDIIRVHCESPNCEGVRRHEKYSSSNAFSVANSHYFWVGYLCTDCRTRVKIFGLKTARNPDEDDGVATKVYQEPAFGQPIPKRLFQVIGEANRDSFLQARRATARGLGIGAYAYYRRIVENTKLELVSSIVSVAKTTNAPIEQVKLLESAQREKQFSKAIEMLRGVAAIPPVLLIDGHNPLTLLHDLLSEGIHALSDGECLERAQHAEVILFEIADRMQVALTERKNVKAALTSIMARNQGISGATPEK
jgi:hypothetical protein